MIDGFLILLVMGLILGLIFCVAIFDALYAVIESRRNRRINAEIEQWWDSQL